MRTTTGTTRALGVIILTTTVALSSGCASIFNGGNRKISVSSQPAGAKVSVTKVGLGELVQTGTTPLTVSLDPRRGYFKPQAYTIKFELAGYKTIEITLRPEISGWYFGNILLGGLIGMVVVDPLTGSMWNLAPDKIEQTLSTEQAALIKEQNGFVVVLVSQVSERERANMIRIN